MRFIDEPYTRTPFYGIRKMTWWLGEQGYAVNPKRVRRLMRSWTSVNITGFLDTPSGLANRLCHCRHLALRGSYTCLFGPLKPFASALSNQNRTARLISQPTLQSADSESFRNCSGVTGTVDGTGPVTRLPCSSSIYPCCSRSGLPMIRPSTSRSGSTALVRDRAEPESVALGFFLILVSSSVEFALAVRQSTRVASRRLAQNSSGFLNLFIRFSSACFCFFMSCFLRREAGTAFLFLRFAPFLASNVASLAACRRRAGGQAVHFHSTFIIHFYTTACVKRPLCIVPTLYIDWLHSCGWLRGGCGFLRRGLGSHDFDPGPQT